jgi:Domain of unknown function (DUF4158)
MPRLQDTAYPRLKSVLSARDLAVAFTPTPDELQLARRSAKGPVAQLGFLVLLKLFHAWGDRCSSPMRHARWLSMSRVSLALLPRL